MFHTWKTAPNATASTAATTMSTVRQRYCGSAMTVTSQLDVNQEKTHAMPVRTRRCLPERPNSLRWHYPDQVRGSATGPVTARRTLSALRSPDGDMSGRGPEPRARLVGHA